MTGKVNRVGKKSAPAKTGKVKKASPKKATKKSESVAGSGLSEAHRENIRKNITFMSELVEQAVDSAVLALVERSTEMSREVVAQDREINQMEFMIDQLCLSILQADSPKNANLRYIMAIMKINNDLERMGNLAVNISEANLYIVQKHSVLEPHMPLGQMLEKTSQMVRESIEALFSGNLKLAREIIEKDDEVDALCDEIMHKIIDVMKSSPEKADAGTFLILAVTSIERIADKAAHIAEEVVYMETGAFPNRTLHSHDSPHR